jgi:mono/diheme cytochrome c family protein
MKIRFERLQWSGVCALILACATGCRQDMHNQPKMIPQRHAAFFRDGRSARQQVPDTVGRSQQVEVSYLTTGLIAGAEGDAIPFPVTLVVMARGQEQFNIYCSPCHSRVGNGKGAIVDRGYYKAGNFQSTRLQQAPLGHFFWVITHGYGAMPNYSVEIRPEDRWAIVAYIRALQLSQNAQSTDVPDGVRVNHMRDLLVQASLPANYLKDWDDSVDSDVPVVRSAPSPALITLAPAVRGAPSSSSAPKPTAEREPVRISSAAPAAERQEKTPPPAPQGDADHGKTLYAASCSACHQPTRAGLPPVFPSLIGIVEKDGEAKVRKVAKEGIPDGKPPMPAHPDYTETDLDDLIAFLKTK